MNAEQNRTEFISILYSTIGNLFIGCVGIVFWTISESQAILLDGFFNLTYAVAGFFTLKVAKLVQSGDDERFPFGYGYFEALVNGIKGILVLGVTIMALVGAIDALLSGGRVISAGTAVIYGAFATAACWLLALLTHRGAKRSNSPLVKADARNWIVNGAISTAVLLAFLSIILIQGTSLDFMAPYVDPILVLVVVSISISVPVRMAWYAQMELLNRAPSRDTVEQVTRIVTSATEALPVEKLFVRVIQPGRTRMVLAHVVLPIDFKIEGLPQLDKLRANALGKLKQAHTATALEMVFTADPQWGAPQSI